MNCMDTFLNETPKPNKDIISVEEARLILWVKYSKYSDWEIIDLIEKVESFGNFLILNFLSQHEKRNSWTECPPLCSGIFW